MSAKEIREKKFFVLYDNNDNIHYMFESYEELQKYINLKLFTLTQKLNRRKHKDEFTFVILDGKLYKLYLFDKD